MKVLVDTHCWLWWFAELDKLNPDARELIRSRSNEIYFSAASSWEIAIKFGLGRLQLPEPPERYVPRRLLSQGMTPLPIEHAHALRVAALPPLHGDPFDRLLVAQAQVERLAILTADEQLKPYDVKLIWAG